MVAPIDLSPLPWELAASSPATPDEAAPVRADRLAPPADDPRPFASPSTVPTRTVAGYRKLLIGRRIRTGHELMVVLFQHEHRVWGERLTAEQARRLRNAARAVWYHGAPCAGGGRAF